MVDVRSGFVDDLEEAGYETEAVVDEVESWRYLDRASVSFGGTLRTEIQHTSNHFAATSSASTASLAAPTTLSTSSQYKNFFSRR